MSNRQVWFEYGDVFGMRYLFENRGDGLAMHSHPPSDEHNAIVLQGEIRVSVPSGWYYDVKAPAIIAHLPEEHELTALVPGTELLNLYKNGKPEVYKSMPDSEKAVTFDTRPLTNALN